MRCTTVRNNLDRFARQELAPRLREPVEAHLRECADCRRHLARQERLAAVLTSVAEPPAVPDGFGDRLMTAAQRRKEKGDRHHLCEAPSGPLRQMVPVPFFRRVGWLRRSVPFGAQAAQAAVLAGGLLLGVMMGQQTWQSVHPAGPQQTSQADPLAIYELDYLSDAPGGSLAQSYLMLTAASNENGTY